MVEARSSRLKRVALKEKKRNRRLGESRSTKVSIRRLRGHHSHRGVSRRGRQVGREEGREGGIRVWQRNSLE